MRSPALILITVPSPYEGVIPTVISEYCVNQGTPAAPTELNTRSTSNRHAAIRMLRDCLRENGSSPLFRVANTFEPIRTHAIIIASEIAIKRIDNPLFNSLPEENASGIVIAAAIFTISKPERIIASTNRNTLIPPLIFCTRLKDASVSIIFKSAIAPRLQLDVKRSLAIKIERTA